MKKKLKIDQLKVQSFVTTPHASRVLGGGTLLNCLPDTETMYSCLHYVSCHILDCVANTHYAACTGNTTSIQVQSVETC